MPAARRRGHRAAAAPRAGSSRPAAASRIHPGPGRLSPSCGPASSFHRQRLGAPRSCGPPVAGHVWWSPRPPSSLSTTARPSRPGPEQPGDGHVHTPLHQQPARPRTAARNASTSQSAAPRAAAPRARQNNPARTAGRPADTPLVQAYPPSCAPLMNRTVPAANHPRWGNPSWQS